MKILTRKQTLEILKDLNWYTPNALKRHWKILQWEKEYDKKILL